MSVTYRTSAVGGSTTNNVSTHTATITPVVGDMFIVFAAISGTTTMTSCTDNNSSGTYTLIDSVLWGSSANVLGVFIRNSTLGSTTSTTVTVTHGSTSTAGEIIVVAVSGALLTGSSLVRNKGNQANQAASGTPAPVLSGSALGTNMVLSCIANTSNPAGVTAPSGSSPTWTRPQNTGQNTPSTGIEFAYTNNGFTGTTVTWGSTSASTFCSYVLELADHLETITQSDTLAVSDSLGYNLYHLYNRTISDSLAFVTTETFAQALGSNEKMSFGTNYSSGTWTDDIASATMSQATSGKRPTTTTPSGGSLFLVFASSSSQFLSNGSGFGITWASRGSSGNGQRIFAFVAKTSTSTGTQTIWKCNGGTASVAIESGVLHWTDDNGGTDATSNSSIADGNYHRVIIRGDDTTGHVDMWIDDVQQTQQGTAPSASGYMGYDWGFSTQVFGSSDGTTFFLNGNLGGMVWATTSTTFSSTDIDNIDLALQTWINGGLPTDSLTYSKTSGGGSGTTYSNTFSDSLALTDALARICDGTRSSSDSAALTETVLRTETFGRSFSDSAALTDSLARTCTFGRAFSDSVTGTDSLTRVCNGTRSLSDTCALTDTSSRVCNTNRVANDTCALTDVTARVCNGTRAGSDSCSLTDALARVCNGTRSFSDTCALAESVLRTATFGRSLSDSLALSDLLSREVDFARLFSDSPILTDLVNREVDFGRLTAEACSLSDAISRVCDGFRALSDSLTLAESYAREIDFGRGNSDTITLADLTSRGFEIARALSDSLALVEQLRREIDFGRSFSDTCSTTETDTRVCDARRAFTDSLALADSIGYQVAGRIIATVNDSCSVSDTCTRIQNATRSLSDTVALTDANAREIDFGRTKSDTCAMTDAIVRVSNATRTVSDSLVLTDILNITLYRLLHASANDTLALADSLSRVCNNTRSVADSAAATDVAVRGLAASRSLADSVSLVDLTSRSRTIGVFLTDTLSVADTTKEQEDPIIRSYFDSIVLTDSAHASRDIHQTIAADYILLVDLLTSLLVSPSVFHKPQQRPHGSTIFVNTQRKPGKR